MYGMDVEENVAICVNQNRKIIGWTEKFGTLTKSHVSQVEMEEFLTQSVLDDLQNGKTVRF